MRIGKRVVQAVAQNAVIKLAIAHPALDVLRKFERPATTLPSGPPKFDPKIAACYPPITIGAPGPMFSPPLPAIPVPQPPSGPPPGWAE
jgi:hypothetical protein